MALEQVRLLGPLLLISFALVFLPITAWRLIRSYQIGKLTRFASLQDAWFGYFWNWFGPRAQLRAAPAVEPLLQPASGVVLDIGPGSGQWVYLYSRKRNKHITKVYGVEPNAEHHAALRRAIKREGLEDIYEVLGYGAEDLQKAGLEFESIDTIVTVQVLCSVPAPQRVINELYKYLKPGGQWILYEHVKTKYSYEFVAKWQVFLDNVWPICFGGCSITRPTDEYLARAGEWSSIDLHAGADEGKFDTIPHSIGYLRK